MNLSPGIKNIISNMPEEIFQIHHPIVRATYQQQKNYRIVETPGDPNYVVIYFSSNGIYFPNTEEEFRNKIVLGDRYDWLKNKLTLAGKHIFIRDVFKQWYVEGVNSEVNSVDETCKRLRELCGDKKIITLGSSSGGYAAMLFGILLKAEYILNFSGQFYLTDVAKEPLLQKNSNIPEKSRYYDLRPLLQNNIIPIFYFYSCASEIDAEQISASRHLPQVYGYSFQAKLHGVPFFLFNLGTILNMGKERLQALSQDYKGRDINLYSFSCRLIGVTETIKQLLLLVYKRIMRSSVEVANKYKTIYNNIGSRPEK